MSIKKICHVLILKLVFILLNLALKESNFHRIYQQRIAFFQTSVFNMVAATCYDYQKTGVTENKLKNKKQKKT